MPGGLLLFAETPVGGTISKHATWTKSGNPYVVESNLRIAAGASLTIEPGVEVRMGRNVNINVYGTIKAKGTSPATIEFTPNVPVSKPYWGSIFFNSSPDRGQSELEHCSIKFAGSRGRGAIVLDPARKLKIDSASLVGNKYNGIELDITTAGAMNLGINSLPYLLLKDTEFGASSQLNIKPGVTIKSADNVLITISGNLHLEGNPDNRIIFTSIADDYADGIDSNGDGPSMGKPGDWGGIHLSDVRDGSYLKFVEVSYAGASVNTQNSLLLIDNSSPLIEHSSFGNSRYYGITLINNSQPDLGGGALGSPGYNSFTGYGKSKYALVNKTSNDISALHCCWNESNENEIDKIIYDFDDKPHRGKVSFIPFRGKCKPTEIAAPNQLKPEENSPAQDLPVVLEWNKAVYASQYELHISPDDTFAGNSTDTVLVADTIFSWLGAGFNSRYYWRVRSVNSYAVSRWPAVWTFKTLDTSKPHMTELAYPAVGDTIACGEEFRWEEIGNARSYHLQISPVSDFSEIYLEARDITETSFPAPELKNDFPFFWRIRGGNANGYGEWTDAGQFSTEALFAAGSEVTGTEYVQNIIAADFNGDGLNDILASGENVIRLFFNYNGNKAGEFIDSGQSFGDFIRGEVTIGDIDNDNDTDIIVSGENAIGTPETKVFENSNGLFNEKFTALPGFKDAAIEICDFNNDGKSDIFLTGTDSYGNREAFLMLLENGIYTGGEIALPASSNPEILSGDFDKDGDQDIIMSGFEADGRFVVAFYRNKLRNTYPEFTTEEIASFGSRQKVLSGDFNSDGYPGLLVYNTESAVILQSDKGNFTGSGKEIPYFTGNNAEAVDIDLDGDIDIVTSHDISGVSLYENIDGDFYLNELILNEVNQDKEVTNIRISNHALFDMNNDNSPDLAAVRNTVDSTGEPNRPVLLFKSNICKENAPPSEPENLRYTFSGESIILEWDKSSDDSTPAKAITYSVKIGSGPGAADIVPARTNKDGQLLIPAAGNAGTNNYYKINGLASGKYYWGVQAIDNSFAVSGFGGEAVFITRDLASGPPDNWFYEKQTGENTLILLRDSDSLQVNGRSLRSGDAVGAFYYRADSLICGGYTIWEEGKNSVVTAWGDNNQTPDVKDGFRFNEHFRIKLWDYILQEEFAVSAVYKEGLSYFFPDTISVVAEFKPLDSISIAIEPLKWQMISSNIAPFSTYLDRFIPYSVGQIISSDNKSYIPGYLGNELTNWTSGSGYYIYSGSGDTIKIKGSRIDPASATLSLPAKRWVIIPYYPEEPLPPNQALESIKDRIILMKNSKGENVMPFYDINQVEDMKPGEGYKVILNSKANLTYPERNAPDGDNKGVNHKGENIHFKHEATFSGNNATAIIKSDDLSEGDEVAIFTKNHVLAGSAVMGLGMAVVTVWGKNPMAAGDDGVRPGDELKVIAWSGRRNEEIILGNLEITDLVNNGDAVADFRYKVDAVWHIKAKRGVNSIMEEHLSKLSKINVAQNDALGELSISLNLFHPDYTKIDLYSITGEKISTILSKYLNSGEHTINWQSDNLSAGVYFLNMRVGTYQTQKKFALMN